MHHPPIVIPNLRSMLRHAVPNIVEGKVVPLVLFVAFLEVLGMVWALLVALSWSVGAIVVRTVTGRRVPGLVVLSATTLAARTVAALATGSMVVYFLQPTVTTFVVGFAFLVSVPLGKPLARKLAYDLLPFDDGTKSHPLVERFFVRLSLFWAFTSLVNASITIWLLLTQSLATFVLARFALSWGVTIGAIAISALWFRTSMARHDIQVRLPSWRGRAVG